MQDQCRSSLCTNLDLNGSRYRAVLQQSWWYLKKDYIAMNKKWRSCISSAKTYPGADCGSEHKLLAAEMSLELKNCSQTTDKPQRRPYSGQLISFAVFQKQSNGCCTKPIWWHRWQLGQTEAPDTLIAKGISENYDRCSQERMDFRRNVERQ